MLAVRLDLQKLHCPVGAPDEQALSREANLPGHHARRKLRRLLVGDRRARRQHGDGLVGHHGMRRVRIARRAHLRARQPHVVVGEQVKLALLDLVGIRHARLFLRRPPDATGLKLRQRRKQRMRAQIGKLVGKKRRVFVGHVDGPAHAVIARVKAFLHAHDAHAGLFVASKDGALDGRGTAPARQQRSMHVQAAKTRNGKHLGGQQHAVRGNAHHVGPKRRQGSLLMATTHYAEMKVYALETPGVVNASCEFNVETLMPTYKLSVGVPGKSNAFLISSKLGIPQNIIDAARSHMSNDDKRLDSVLAQLDDLKMQLKVAQGDAEKARYEAEHALESAEKKRDELIKKGEQELEDARRRAHDLMQNVQNEAYALTDELRRIQKDEKTNAAQRAVRAREIARKDTETLLKKTDSKPKPAREFVPLKEVQIGQEVLIAELNQLATVTARPDRNGMVEVRAGIMKTKVPLSGLCVPDKMDKRPAREPRRSSTRVQLDKSRKASMEINLLGYTVDEALAEVDKFLDSGMLRGQQTLYIIHGNGTGALRTAIQKHLRTHKAVKSFRPGRYGEGENGVTVVELK